MTQAHISGRGFTHPIIDRTPLDGATGATAGLVGAELVHNSHLIPHSELWLTFTDGTRSWVMKLQPTEVKSV